MARTIRFHLDEHVGDAVAAGIRCLSIDVTTTKDANLLGASDGQQLEYAKSQGRVIFSEDHDFLALASRGATHAGIAYCRQQSRSVGEIVRALELIWEVYEPAEMENRVEYI